jgi:F0F1-type ATP synthase assembly protein I
MEKPKNRYIQLVGIAAQMGATIFLGAYFGKMLDEKYPSNKKWFTMGLTIFSVAIALYMVLKQVNKINEDDKKQ